MGQWIWERTTYLDSGARDEQNEPQLRSFSSTRTSVAWNVPILPCKIPLNWENPKMGQWIRERPTYLDSGAQDKQNEPQHCSFSSTRTSVAWNGPILPCKISLNWENPNMGQWIREQPTYLDSGAQDEQNEPQHCSFSSTRTSVSWNGPILPCKIPLNWENPNMDQWIREQPTYLDSGAQDEQNDNLLH